MDDHQLLVRYAAENSEAAFTALVARHIALVYSSALRHAGSAGGAEEITSAVFIILARKAGSLSAKTILPGWLYQTTRLTAANYLRSERRRQQREHEAFMQSTLNENDGARRNETEAWRQIAPLLDDALATLRARDRDALVLRFFENKSTREIASALRVAEPAAHKRVTRALEKLRKFFSKRGVTLTATAIAGAVSANSVSAAPVGLAKTISVGALTKGAAAGTSTLFLVKGTMKFMAWTKTKITIAFGALALLVVGRESYEAYLDVYSPNWIEKFQNGLVPPMTIIHQTHHWFPHNGGGSSGKFLGKSNDFVIIGNNMPFQNMIAAAFNFRERRVIFPPNLPAGQFDYLSSVPNNAQENLQEKIRKQFGYTGRKIMVETNAFLLRASDSSSNKLTKSLWPKAMRQLTNNPNQFENWPTQPMSTVASYLEAEMKIPVLDQTGLTNFFDMSLEWKRQKVSQELNNVSLKKAMHEQLGLELIPTNMPVEMLVVERVK